MDYTWGEMRIGEAAPGTVLALPGMHSNANGHAVNDSRADMGGPAVGQLEQDDTAEQPSSTKPKRRAKKPTKTTAPQADDVNDVEMDVDPQPSSAAKGTSRKRASTKRKQTSDDASEAVDTVAAPVSSTPSPATDEVKATSSKKKKFHTSPALTRKKKLKIADESNDTATASTAPAPTPSKSTRRRKVADASDTAATDTLPATPAATKKTKATAPKSTTKKASKVAATPTSSTVKSRTTKSRATKTPAAAAPAADVATPATIMKSARGAARSARTTNRNPEAHGPHSSASNGKLTRPPSSFRKVADVTEVEKAVSSHGGHVLYSGTRKGGRGGGGQMLVLPSVGEVGEDRLVVAAKVLREAIGADKAETLITTGEIE